MLSIGVSEDARPKQGTLSVSRGMVFERTYRVPYILPAGCEAHIIITDAGGVTLGDFEGEVSDQSIHFQEFGDAVDGLPHGAGYLMSITYPDIGDPSPVEYGTVIRTEPRFTLLPPADSSDTAIKFALDFTNSTLLGPKFITKNGKPQVLINQPTHANAVGVDWLLFQSAAFLFYAPVNGDDITMNVKLRNPGAGKTTIVVCSDYNMTEYLGVQFESGVSNNFIHMVTGSGPIAMANQGSAVANTVAAETDTYQIKYNSLSDTLQVFKNGSGTAAASFTDTGTVGHGLGHRYWGANWQGSLVSGGIQIVSMNAADNV